MNIDEQISYLNKGLSPDTFYMIRFTQIYEGIHQHFYVYTDTSGVRLTRNSRIGNLFNSDVDSLSMIMSLAHAKVLERTNQSPTVHQDMDIPASKGDWTIDLVPYTTNLDNVESRGFSVEVNEPITDGYKLPSILSLTSESVKPSASVLDVTEREYVDATIIEGLNKSVTPDFFDGFNILTVKDVLTLLRSEEWHNTEKVKAAGQHAVRQKKQYLIYEFGINGVIHQDVLSELHQVLSKQGWSSVSTAITGVASGTWTKLMLHRKVVV